MDLPRCGRTVCPASLCRGLGIWRPGFDGIPPAQWCGNPNAINHTRSNSRSNISLVPEKLKNIQHTYRYLPSLCDTFADGWNWNPKHFISILETVDGIRFTSKILGRCDGHKPRRAKVTGKTVQKFPLVQPVAPQWTPLDWGMGTMKAPLVPHGFIRFFASKIRHGWANSVTEAPT